MNITILRTADPYSSRGQQIFGTRLHSVLALIGALGIGLLMVSAVLALNSYQTFHATGEQVDLGIGVSGSYTDTLAADGTYRVIKEEVVSDKARTLGDNPSGFDSRATYTDIISFVPYTMPAEGGTIYRIGLHVFESGDTQFRVALYEDTEGLPHALLTQSEPLTATSTGWLWFDIEPQLFPGNTPYWLAHQANNDNAKLGWKWSSAQEGYRFRGWAWGAFPSVAGSTSGPIQNRTYYQIAYTATQHALDVTYAVPVTTGMDAYTLTVQGATSGEPFSVTADGQAVGVVSYSPTTQNFISDDMESSTNGWITTGFTHTITDSQHYSSPTHVWWTDDVPYSSTASLTSVPITLPFNAHDIELRFWHRMVSEFEWDGGWLEYRIHNDDQTWGAWSELTDTMFVQGGYNTLLQHVPSGTHWGWSWMITNVVRIQVPVTAAGHSIQWRWIFECDPIGAQGPQQPDGWWIDDVRMFGTVSEDANLVFSLPLSFADDGQVTVRFQDTITNSYPDLLGIDLIEVTGFLYNRPPTMTVTTPNGGEYWGGTRTIEWRGSDPNRDVITYNVYLSTDGGGTWTTSLYQVSYNETETPATHTWNGLDTTAFGDSTNCLIRIEASDGAASASGRSDAPFTIDNTPPSVTLTAPNGGELLRGGTNYTITWSASDAHFGSTPIALYYSTDGGASFLNLITAATENDGSYMWAVPALDNANIRVRVVATDLAGNSNHDDSDASFTIDSTAPSVTLTAPNGGEVLQGGSNYIITWNASDAHLGSSPIALYYSTDGGVSFPNAIATATENDGSYMWTVPAFNNTLMRVRVEATDLVGHSNYDDSDANFTIDSTAPSVTLTAPNGSELLRGGTNYTITWSASDAHFGSTPIALYYSTDGGASFPNAITTATENDGSYMWAVPALDNANVRVRVVATDLAGNSNRDDSNANFTIDSTAPSVTLTTPNGGEYLRGGTNYTITWSASDAYFGSTPIALYYSTDGGASFPNAITTATENDGSYTWSVPALNNANVWVRVVATDLVSNSNSDNSDANFTIDSTTPSVTLIAPNGSELFYGGGSCQITWNTSDAHFGSTPIALYYSTDSGTSFPNIITTTTENDGSYTWTVPALDSSKVRVRVVATDLAGNSNYDDSDANFTINSTSPEGTVTIAEGDYTNSRDIHLILGAPDDTIDMYLDGDLTDASNVRQWITYTTNATVTLTTGEGSKTVLVTYRDVAGNESSNPASDTIIYDITLPTMTGETPADGTTVTVGKPTISAILADTMSGIDGTTIAMTIDSTLVVHTYNESSGIVSYTPSSTLANAWHVVTISAKDRAGNSESWTWSFLVDATFEVYLPFVVRVQQP